MAWGPFSVTFPPNTSEIACAEGSQTFAAKAPAAVAGTPRHTHTGGHFPVPCCLRAPGCQGNSAPQKAEDWDSGTRRPVPVWFCCHKQGTRGRSVTSQGLGLVTAEGGRGHSPRREEGARIKPKNVADGTKLAPSSRERCPTPARDPLVVKQAAVTDVCFPLFLSLTHIYPLSHQSQLLKAENSFNTVVFKQSSVQPEGTAGPAESQRGGSRAPVLLLSEQLLLCPPYVHGFQSNWHLTERIPVFNI